MIPTTIAPQLDLSTPGITLTITLGCHKRRGAGAASPPLAQLRAAWAKASPAERRQFLAEVAESTE